MSAMAAHGFSMRWRRPAFSAGPTARAGGRCVRTCVFLRPRLRRRRPDFVPANAASPALLRGVDLWIRVRAHIERNLDRAVSLAELGRVAGMSPFTVQRTFKQEMGVSPLQYQRSLRAGRLRGALKQSGRVTDAIYEAGFGSSSRAYEGAQLGMTPAQFAKGGEGEQIGWCSAPSPFGRVIVGATERGLCWLSLAGTAAEAEESLRAEFPAAELRRDTSLSRLVDAALQMVRDGSGLVWESRAAGSAGSARDGFSIARVAGSPPDSARGDAQLQRSGTRNGRAESDAGGGAGLRDESRGAGSSLPSRGGSERIADWISVGRGAEAKVAGSRKRMTR